MKAIDEACETECMQPCLEEEFDARITTSLWPRDEYFATIQSAWIERNTLIGTMNASEARSQIAKLEVYFRVGILFDLII